MPESPMCEACRIRQVVTLVHEDDPSQPYRLCGECSWRLERHALRPVEWFNLAALHATSKYQLHEDFYDEAGLAFQPDVEVEDAELYPAPTLEEASKDLERLIDYAMTPWLVDEPTYAALRFHDPNEMVRSLAERVEAYQNLEIEGRAYEICEHVVGEPAADWLRSRWANWRPETFRHLAAASAACMPFDEAFSAVTSVLEDGAARDRLHFDGFKGATMGDALAAFRSPRTLDWMEAHPEMLTHSSWVLVHHEHWGYVAALSHFSWPRAAQWLARGWPLSFIALAAMNSCCGDDTRLKRPRPTLELPASVELMLQTLDAYQDAGCTARERNMIAKIRQGLGRA